MIRVIIERRIKEGKERELLELLYELRTKAMRWPGFVSGQTLVGYDDPSLYIVISTWLTAEQWQAWVNSAERREIAARLEPLLSVPAKITILRFLEE